MAIVACTTLEELTEDGSSNGSVDAIAVPTTLPGSSTPTPQQEFQSLVSELNTKGLITQELVEDLLAKKSRLDSIDPEVNDPEVAMQVLADFNASLKTWGGNLEEVLALSQDLLGEIGPQGRAGLHSPLLVSCNDVVSLNKTMDKVQKDIDEAKTARDRMLAVDRDKDFDKFESEYRSWRTSYKTATKTANNELVKGPPAAQAGAFMAGATALAIGVVGGTAAVISAPAILTIAAVGVGTGVAVNWVWDLLTPQPKGSISQGTPLAAPLSVGESCRFISSASENQQPSVFSDTGLGNLHIFMEDRAPLVFENFSINSGEQVTLTVEPPALDGITAEELADAIEGAEIAVEEIGEEELDATPEPTAETAPTPTPESATTEPPSDQGLINLTASQVKAAVAQFSNDAGWIFSDADEVITDERSYSYRSGKVFTEGLQDCADDKCSGTATNYTLWIHFSPTGASQDEVSFSSRDTHCTVSAFKSAHYRSAVIRFEIWESFSLKTVRVNGIPIPPDDACDGFSTEFVQEEARRAFDDFLILLGP